MARVDPIPAREWTPEVLAAIAPLDPKGRRHPRPPRDDPASGLAALGTFAHHPGLARAFTTFNGHVLWDTALTPRQRQLLILRVVHRRQSNYIWNEHARSSIHAGLTAEEIERVRSAPEQSSWDPLEAALLRAVDELIDDGVIARPTWDVLAGQLDVQQLADLVATVGCYETTAFLLRTFGLDAPG